MPDSIVPLDTSIHQRDLFTCGNVLLDRYLHSQAAQDIKKRAATCFVLAEDSDVVIKGYYTLSNLSIPRSSVPQVYKKKLASYGDVPVTLLGRLAVDTKFRGQGYGELLLMDALKKSFEATSAIASWAVVVDPIDEDAVNFYKKYGFILIPDSGKMFLPIKTVEALFK